MPCFVPQSNVLPNILLPYLRHAFFVNISRTQRGKYFAHCLESCKSTRVTYNERHPCLRRKGCPYSDKVNIFIRTSAFILACISFQIFSLRCGVRFLFKITRISSLFILLRASLKTVFKLNKKKRSN